MTCPKCHAQLIEKRERALGVRIAITTCPNGHYKRAVVRKEDRGRLR